MGSVTLTIQPSTSGLQNPRAGRYQANQAQFQMGISDFMGDGPGRRLRKNVANVRRHVDYVSTVLNYTEARLWQYGRRQRILQQPDELYQNTALPVHCTPDVPVDCVLTKFIRAAMNKIKCPVYSLCWSPEGKRLITGTQTGEFTLWNGTAFNFETILQAHDTAIRALKWSYNEQWLLSADQDGYVKYWQPNMNNAHMFSAHKDEAVRGIAFSPTDLKFATASDDGTARIWDFARYSEDRILRGHGSEVRCIDWHPSKGLLVTGSRDTQQPVKLWDPKAGTCLATLQEHKSSVMAVEFNKNGNWLLTGGRDHLIKMYDIRVMKELQTYRAHKKEVISLAWHPIHEGLFVSGGGDGSIVYWLVDNPKEIGLLEHAHDQAIWAMKWHPLGHILATGSNDNNTKFWARNRPGDTVEDIFGLSAATMVGHLDKEREPKAVSTKSTLNDVFNNKPDIYIPGMGLDEALYEQINKDVESTMTPLLVPDDLTRVSSGPMIGAKKTLIKQPPAKKAQRQFERMWNNSKGIGAGTDDFSAVLGGMGREDQAAAMENGRMQKSLLGAPPTPSFLGKPSSSLMGPPPVNPSLLSRPPDFGVKPSSWRPQPFHDDRQNESSIKFDKNGVPILPPGLPPHLWPMPPGMSKPMMSNTGGDIDYRNAPPGPSPSKNTDIDLRSIPSQNPVTDSWRTTAPQQSTSMQPPVQDPRSDPRLQKRTTKYFREMLNILEPEDVSELSSFEIKIRKSLSLLFRFALAVFTISHTFEFLFSSIWMHGYIWCLNLPIDLDMTDKPAGLIVKHQLDEVHLSERLIHSILVVIAIVMLLFATGFNSHPGKRVWYLLKLAMSLGLVCSLARPLQMKQRFFSSLHEGFYCYFAFFIVGFLMTYRHAEKFPK
ncbi:unnamed protein product [Caenorhabditis bovis]|uniref:IFT140 first beta-propeller domain-containing protein n=1 Tax=Caenorhabditis bovis TaxID=2654633 RepID=A0A8S1FE07_9PELO|nr:unnamed protein product [Caenorhabditis bovis]